MADILAEYRDPRRYDAEYGAYAPDGPFYERLALASGGPVLDVGCGTGRIAIPLARLGLRVTGTDLAPEMLAHAATKGAGLPVDWVCADARHLDLGGRRYRFAIMAANAFQHLTSEAGQRAALERIHAHLAPGGRFAFNLRNPVAHDLGDHAEEAWHTFTNGAGRTVEVSGTQTYDPSSKLMTYTTIRCRRDGQGERREARDLTIRFADVAEVEVLARAVGYTSVERHGGFAGEAFDLASSSGAVLILGTS